MWHQVRRAPRVRRAFPVLVVGAVLAITALLAVSGCTLLRRPVRSPLDDRGAAPSAPAGATSFPPPFPPPSASPTPAPASATATPAPGGDREAVAGAAIDVFAERSGLPATRFTLDRIEPEQWPDSCLGVAIPGVACAQVVTPGYRVVLRFATGSLHEVRSGRAGQFAWAPQARLQVTVLEAERAGVPLTLDAGGGNRLSMLIGPGTQRVDLPPGVLKAGDRVVLGADDLRDGSPWRVAWIARNAP